MPAYSPPLTCVLTRIRLRLVVFLFASDFFPGLLLAYIFLFFFFLSGLPSPIGRELWQANVCSYEPFAHFLYLREPRFLTLVVPFLLFMTRSSYSLLNCWVELSPSRSRRPGSLLSRGEHLSVFPPFPCFSGVFFSFLLTDGSRYALLNQLPSEYLSFFGSPPIPR